MRREAHGFNPAGLKVVVSLVLKSKISELFFWGLSFSPQDLAQDLADR